MTEFRAAAAVLCDLDGVLRQWPDPRTIEDRYGLATGRLLATAFEPERLLRAVTGQITDEEWRASIRADLATEFGADAASGAVQEWSSSVGTIDQAVLTWLDRVRRGVPVVLVSNATTRLEQDLEALGLAGRFDAVVNTSRIGAAKPDPRVFAHAASVAGVPTESCLLLDDSAGHVAAARGLGMSAVLFTGVTSLGEAARFLPAIAESGSSRTGPRPSRLRGSR